MIQAEGAGPGTWEGLGDVGLLKLVESLLVDYTNEAVLQRVGSNSACHRTDLCETLVQVK